MRFVFLIAAAYLLGSVPFGLIIARAHGINLRKIGSGNIGATNLSRALGRRWAYFCFVLDMLKGLIPTALAGKFVSAPPTIGEQFLWLAVGCAAIGGHIFPVYLRFKGGKGISTSFGVALGLWPYYTISSLIVFAVWIVVVLLWRYISLASITAAVCFPLTLSFLIAIREQWQFGNLWPLLITAAVIPILVVALHRENIKRLLAGTENKVMQGRKVSGNNEEG